MVWRPGSVILLFATLPALAQSGEEILARVDRLRHPWPTFQVELTVKEAKTNQRWRVSARENGDARLDGLSEKEKGRAVLMLGDQMWLLLPGSKRPLKVTPQQRMMGSAAGGDVARTRFHKDYVVQGLDEDVLDDRPCWRLDLAARTPALSARTVRLWVAKERLLPLKAEFLLASGKVAHTALFGPPVPALGQLVLSWMQLAEPGGAQVELTFSHWSRGGVGAELFELPEAVPGVR
jgi:outer membrane lipoprotein-sorting protein